jgi:hypothetical protein
MRRGKTQDLQRLMQRQQEASGPNAVPFEQRTATDNDEKREKEADELMQQFLSARRKERVEEQKGRYNTP